MIPVFGFVATDYDGTLAINNKPVGFSCPKAASALDQAFLRRGIGLICEQGKPLAVIGERSYHQIKGTKLWQLLQTYNLPIFVSGESACGLDSPDKPYKSDDTLKEMRQRAFTTALDEGCDSMIVLGGRSVYVAFDECYDSIQHTVFRARFNEAEPYRWDIPNEYQQEVVLYDDTDMLVQVMTYQPN